MKLVSKVVLDESDIDYLVEKFREEVREALEFKENDWLVRGHTFIVEILEK